MAMKLYSLLDKLVDYTIPTSTSTCCKNKNAITNLYYQHDEADIKKIQLFYVEYNVDFRFHASNFEVNPQFLT